jgi:hypothetical protein
MCNSCQESINLWILLGICHYGDCRDSLLLEKWRSRSLRTLTSAVGWLRHWLLWLWRRRLPLFLHLHRWEWSRTWIFLSLHEWLNRMHIRCLIGYCWSYASRWRIFCQSRGLLKRHLQHPRRNHGSCCSLTCSRGFECLWIQILDLLDWCVDHLRNDTNEPRCSDGWVQCHSFNPIFPG